MTDHEVDTRQNWKGMDGATAYHLIERHAEDWEEIGQMMNAWLRANTASLRAELAAANLYKPCQRKDTPHVPVKAIGKCNFSFWRIDETDLEFAERAGAKVKEVTE